MRDLDTLLHLAAVLGADAAWLVRGADEASLHYTAATDGAEAQLLIHEHPGDLGPTILVARFVRDDLEDQGVTELKPPAISDREIQIAALLSAAMDALTRVGPNTTRRVLEWLLSRYGIGAHLYAINDRRPPRPAAPSLPDPPPAPVRPDPRLERGMQLRERRRGLGLTQRALAERAGIDSVTISRIERGKIEGDEATWGRIEAALEGEAHES